MGSFGKQGLLANQFYLTGNLPNSRIAFVSACILCDGYLRLSRTHITYRNCECAGSHIVDFVVFPYFKPMDWKVRISRACVILYPLLMVLPLWV